MKELLERLVACDPSRFEHVSEWGLFRIDGRSYYARLLHQWVLEELDTLGITEIKRLEGQSWEESILQAIVEKMEEGK